MIKMNRRGVYVLPYLVLLALLMVLVSTFLIIIKAPDFDHYIGKSSHNIDMMNYEIYMKQLLNDYNVMEKILHDEKRFYKNGAFSSNSPCGSLDGFQLFYRNGRKCFPDVDSEFQDYIGSVLEKKVSVIGDDVFIIEPKNSVIKEDNISMSYSMNTRLQINHPKFPELKEFIDKVDGCDNKDCVYSLVDDYGLSSDCLPSKADKFIEDYLKCQDSFDADCICNVDVEGEHNITFFEKSVTVDGKTITSYVNTSYYYSDEKRWKESINVKTGDNIVMDSRYMLRKLSFYKDYDDSLAVVVKNTKNLKECRIPDYDEFKLCKKSGDRYMLFDNKYYEDNIMLSFGVILKHKAPPGKITDLVVKDKRNMEDTIEISFTPVDDAVLYNVYYSDEPFDNVEGMEKYVQLYANEMNTFDIHLEDGKKYYVAVAPVNIFGIENKEVLSKEIIPIDDVAPSPITDINGEKGNTITLESSGTLDLQWEEPTTNVNGFPLNDLDGYFIFYKDFARGLTKEECIQRDGCIYSSENRFTITGVEGELMIRIVAIDEVPNYVDISSGHDINVPVEHEEGLIWPAVAPLASCYGYRYLSNGKKDWHHGIDIAVPVGTEVKAVADGIIYSTCINPKNVLNRRAERICHGFGTNVIIYHPTLGTYSRYNHLSRLYVTKGQYVKQGDIIGLTGNTGYSEGAHLDFKYFLSEDFSEKPGDYSENPLCHLPYDHVSYTPSADSCRDKDGDGKSRCSI